MSTEATSTHADAHEGEHGHASGEHHPHVLPISAYLAVFGTLLVLTFITVAASRVDLGNANLIIALGIATMKALCVALIFMHLLFDRKFNAIVFSSSLIFLSIFIGFTMSDTSWRGHDGRSSADGPAHVQDPFSETRSQAAVERLYEKPGAKEVPWSEQVVGPKTDIGLFEQTPQPTWDAITVDVPSARDAPGAPHFAPSNKEE